MHAKRLFRQHGLSWRDMTRKAHEVIVFGSASVGADRRDSDLDLLIIGVGKRFKKRDLDIVFKTKRESLSPKWLGSELADHVARYGVWLKGVGRWRRTVLVGNAAVDFKRHLIRSRARALFAAWETLGEPYRIKHVIKLRRDLQRLECLIEGKSIPPTPYLDKEWRALKMPALKILAAETKTANGQILTKKQIELFDRFIRRVGPSVLSRKRSF